MRRLLFPVELHSRCLSIPPDSCELNPYPDRLLFKSHQRQLVDCSITTFLWKPAEELNLVPFRPALTGSV